METLTQKDEIWAAEQSFKFSVSAEMVRRALMLLG